MKFSGPMFENAEDDDMKSVSGKDGGHYNVFAIKRGRGMDVLRRWFPSGEADEMNFVLFSTSGVHGTYSTIEEEEAPDADRLADLAKYGETHTPSVTFQIIQPRLCTIRYGLCEPRTPEDFAFLKALRQSSWEAVQEIGRPS